MTQNGRNKDESDQDLIGRFQSGDEHAFDELVIRHQAVVLQFCHRFLNSTEDARDASQDIFIKVYQSAHLFQPHARFSTWLYRICVNECLNRIRSRKRRKWQRLFSLEDDYANQVVDPTDNPLQSLEKMERMDQVRLALNALPEEQRTAVILHRYEGLSYQEIAQITSSSVAAVESRLHRAKKNLAVRLTEMVKK
jgi:RNA polymerase sigma-70 factor, ECF subfamily